MALARSRPLRGQRHRHGATGTRGARVTGAILGLEQEFLVWRGEERVDFRRLIKDLAMPGQRLDPGDPHAHRTASGVVITADAKEAEVVLPPLRRRRGYSQAIDSRRL